MADHADGDGVGDNIFIYRGGHAPRHVTHVRIDKSVDVIEEHAFIHCEHLIHVETHDGIREVEEWAFYGCKLLRRINFKSVVEIGMGAIWKCKALIDIELSDRLETIKGRAFLDCKRLQRIAIPLKRDLFSLDDLFDMYTQFHGCEQLTTVDLIGGIHKTVSSLHMESWRTEMIARINRINQVLPVTQTRDKTDEIQQWMDSVLNKMDHYKAEHHGYIKEATNLLELALWKTRLGAKEDNYAEGRTKKAKVDAESARKERRVTCGADIVIKNVLPFLKLV